MVQTNLEKQKKDLERLIWGILSESKRPIQKVQLAKLILFAEIEHYRRTGKSITGLYFVKQRMGPVIAFFDEVLVMGEEKDWKKESMPIYIKALNRETRMDSYSSIRKIEPQKLLPEVTETIKKNIKEYGRMTGTKLSRLAHELPAYEEAESNEPIYVSELAAKTKELYFEIAEFIEESDDTKELEEALSPILSGA